MPMMVGCPGGVLVGGAGSIFDGAIMAAQGHAIVVTINYRVNAFGFLALPSQGKDQFSGEYGLIDQQAAMRWVRSNATAFGGDPRNVTIFGESAAGASASIPMTTPAAGGRSRPARAEGG